MGIFFVHFWSLRGNIINFSFNYWKKDSFEPHFGIVKIIWIVLWVFFWTGFVFFILAFSKPYSVVKEKIFLGSGVDMIFVLDESPSMTAPDFEPNRFQAAKAVLRNFINRRVNDRIGLVTFSSDAVLRVPPTLDYQTLLNAINHLKIMELGEGTAIGMGIGVASVHLNRMTAVDKVIVVLTDGINNEGEVSPLEAAELAEKLGIRVYTIGIGRQSMVSWELADPESGVIRNMSSQGFDEKLLMRVANMANGEYFYAGNPQSLNYIFDKIDSLEKTEKRFRVHVEKRYHYQLLTLFGFLLVLLHFVFRKWIFREVF
ncbi:MAG: VWA domain-containing protein [Spirochaetales bacterium]|nr:VWA domain-containing protein [Spirochaetales bacterium]